MRHAFPIEYDNFAFVYVIGREEKLFVILVGENSPPELCKKELFFTDLCEMDFISCKYF